MIMISAETAGLLHEDVDAYLFQGFRCPLVLMPSTERIRDDVLFFRNWFQDRRALLDRLLDNHGALLFRGFPVKNAEQFSDLIAHYEAHRSGYAAGAVPRAAVAKGVFESTRLPAEYKLPLHQEMAYMANFPRKIVFHCEIAPESGGETILCNMGDVYEALPGALRELFEVSGVEYVRNFRDDSSTSPFVRKFFSSYHRSWQEAFGTDDRLSAESQCAALDLGFEWKGDGSLTVRYVGPASVTHRASGRKIWFNQVCAQHSNPITLGDAYQLAERYYQDQPAKPYDVRFGDGQTIQFECIKPIYEILNRFETSFTWQDGDVLLVDNVVMAHGRNPYTGRRKVNVALLE